MSEICIMLQSVISRSIIDGVNVVAISGAKYLSQVFTFLPSGIVDKTHPGVGGTTLELTCNRASIVIVPYVNTAYNKAKSMQGVFYYGYIGNSDSEKIEDKRITLNTFLKEYVTESKVKGSHLKIICINDHLIHLKAALINLGIDFNSIHLLFDEIDSMQDQSSFRASMEQSMDVLNGHPDRNKTLLSATLREFSDKQISQLTKTKFIFTDASSPFAFIRPSYYLKDEIIATVQRLLEGGESNKILLAVNDIQCCYDLCTLIPEKVSSILKEDIAVLCSESNEKLFADNYYRLPESGILPKRINIITSAYFNGCDIHDDECDLVIQISQQHPNMMLSPATVFQIMGRARQGFKSTQILYYFGSNPHTLTRKSVKFCTDQSELKRVIGFLNLMNNESQTINSEITGSLVNMSINTVLEDITIPIRKNLKDELVVSYFKLDLIKQLRATEKTISVAADYFLDLRKYIDYNFEPERSLLANILEKDRKQTCIDMLSDVIKNVERMGDKKFIQVSQTLLDSFKKVDSELASLIFRMVISALRLKLNLLEIENIKTTIQDSKTWKNELKKQVIYLEFNATRKSDKVKSKLVSLFNNFYKINSPDGLTKVELVETRSNMIDILSGLSSITPLAELIKNDIELAEKALLVRENSVTKVKSRTSVRKNFFKSFRQPPQIMSTK